MKKTVLAEILSNDALNDDIFDMTVKAPELAETAVPGQFAELYANSEALLLPRPISICGIDKEKGTLRFVYQRVGKGTELFSALKAGDKIRILGTCGNGYTQGDESMHHILVGGGIGVPPLLELAKRLKGRKTVILGFRSGEILAEEFKKYADEVHIATDDGSIGFKGNAVQLLESLNIKGDMIYSCGPKIMLKFLSLYAEKNGIACQVSTEERMACGIGACVGCVIKIKNGEDWAYKKVCKDGPVFDSREVIWE